MGILGYVYLHNYFWEGFYCICEYQSAVAISTNEVCFGSYKGIVLNVIVMSQAEDRQFNEQ